jgi:hypothetical protein
MANWLQFPQNFRFAPAGPLLRNFEGTWDTTEFHPQNPHAMNGGWMAGGGGPIPARGHVVVDCVWGIAVSAQWPASKRRTGQPGHSNDNLHTLHSTNIFCPL